ncbi:hypothetical protein A0H81_07328 [Grifola frondosa]|uniref:Uncharacterized protein n=1 Tax=Grifola frondosa TaxID=5627 RepID=A0A1C7M8Q3_GRIFR|nr:hypothetical protein A0H81_07328 [Grifola frondosa]
MLAGCDLRIAPRIFVPDPWARPKASIASKAGRRSDDMLTCAIRTATARLNEHRAHLHGQRARPHGCAQSQSCTRTTDPPDPLRPYRPMQTYAQLQQSCKARDESENALLVDFPENTYGNQAIRENDVHGIRGDARDAPA